MADLTAREIMTPDPVTVAPDATVVDAAKLMAENRVGALPVLDGERLVGLVTESDLIMQDVKLEFPTYIHLLDGFIMYPPSTVRFEHELKKAVAATVADVMTEDPVTVSADAPLEDLASRLSEQDISRLPVLDGDRLIGIVSKHDIVRAIAAGLS
ncbi:MAG TPA: CBS domain-containing protein [Coriobacteriia bacterium]|nr:CBS domain-containing protein [Coriobacteriia bacterium]